MKIELLYFNGCPSWQSGLKNLHSAVKADGLDVPVELIQILHDEDAAQRKFLGSPSFRINGVEVWDEERNIYPQSFELITVLPCQSLPRQLESQAK